MGWSACVSNASTGAGERWLALTSETDTSDEFIMNSYEPNIDSGRFIDERAVRSAEAG